MAAADRTHTRATNFHSSLGQFLFEGSYCGPFHSAQVGNTRLKPVATILALSYREVMSRKAALQISLAVEVAPTLAQLDSTVLTDKTAGLAANSYCYFNTFLGSSSFADCINPCLADIIALLKIFISHHNSASGLDIITIAHIVVADPTDLQCLIAQVATKVVLTASSVATFQAI